MKTHSARRLLIACVVAGLAAASPAYAADVHQHGVHPDLLRLNAGAKWRTDAPLREGMLKIRQNVEPKLHAIHTGRFTDDQYEALGKAVEAQLAYIVGNCKLEPDADAVLHGVIAGLSDGAEILGGRRATGDRSAGAVHIVDALDNYGRYFDHPQWKPIAAGH